MSIPCIAQFIVPITSHPEKATDVPVFVVLATVFAVGFAIVATTVVLP